jgi:hypothetical protein
MLTHSSPWMSGMEREGVKSRDPNTHPPEGPAGVVGSRGRAAGAQRGAGARGGCSWRVPPPKRLWGRSPASCEPGSSPAGASPARAVGQGPMRFKKRQAISSAGRHQGISSLVARNQKRGARRLRFRATRRCRDGVPSRQTINQTNRANPREQVTCSLFAFPPCPGGCRPAQFNSLPLGRATDLGRRGKPALRLHFPV